MNRFNLIILFLTSLSINAYAQKKVAIVNMVRGDVKVKTVNGNTQSVKKGDWIIEGSKIVTSDKSLCKLKFIDKSSMNVGPNSEMKIEKFSKKDAGVINVLSGKIRSKVSKDYLEMNKNKSKMFVRSKSSVMGIRGTDFLFSVNKKTQASTAILFEGSVVFNKIKRDDDIRDLESIVNNGRRIRPGEFSVVNNRLARPTVSAKMNSVQLRSLEKNSNFEVIDKPNIKQKKILRSVVPPGLSGEIISNENSGLKKDLQKIVNLKPKSEMKINQEKIQDSKGYVRGDDIRPPDGTIVHIDSGTIIPLGSDSKFDRNSQEWVSSSVGSVNPKGDYIPPQGFKITDDGKLLKIDRQTGKELQVMIDVRPINETPPLDSIRVKNFNPNQNDQQPPEASRALVKNPFGKKCDGAGCLPPPPVCNGCGIVPPTFNSGASSPQELDRTINRRTSPVKVRVRKR